MRKSILLLLALVSYAATALAEQPDEVISAADIPATSASAPAPARSDAPAPQTERKGFYLGIHLPIDVISGDFDIDTGAGFGFSLGYHFDPPIGLEINWARSGHQTGGPRSANVTFSELSLNAKVDLRSEGWVIPFLIAGIGTFELGDKSLLLGGTGYSFGIGADAAISRHNMLGLSIIRKVVTYDKVLKSDPPATLDEDLDGDMVSIVISFTHYF